MLNCGAVSLFLSLLVTLAPCQQEGGLSHCNQLTAFDAVDKYYTKSEAPANLDFTLAWPKVLETKKGIGTALGGVDFALGKTQLNIPTILPVGNTSLERRFTYKVMTPAKPTVAVDGCAAANGRLPYLIDADDVAALPKLAKRYGVTHMYIQGKFTKSGVYDFHSGYKLGSYGTASNSAFKEADKEHGALDVTISGDTAILGSSKADSAAVPLPYLCTTFEPQIRRSKVYHGSIITLLRDIRSILTLWADDVNHIILQVTDNDGDSTTTLETAPANVSSTAIPISEINLGYTKVQPIIQLLSSHDFWGEGKLDHYGLLLLYKSALREARKSAHRSRNQIRIPLSSTLQHYLTKRSANDTYADTELERSERGLLSLVTAPLISYVAATVTRPFANKIVQGIVSYADKNVPNIVYFLRSYFLGSNELHGENWLVRRGKQLAFTTNDRPRRSGCQTMEDGEVVCRSGPLVDEKRRKYRCGGAMLDGRLDDECSREETNHDIIFYPSVNCGATGDAPNERRASDAIISKHPSTIDYICGGGTKTKQLKLQRGLNLFPIEWKGNCIFTVDNRVIYERPRGPDFQLGTDSRVYEGYRPVDVPPKTISTFLGDFNHKEIRNLIIGITLSMIMTAVLSVVCGCARTRNKSLDFFFPCCRGQKAMQKWKKRCDCCCADEDSNQGCVGSGGDIELPEVRRPARSSEDPSMRGARGRSPSMPNILQSQNLPPDYYRTSSYSPSSPQEREPLTRDFIKGISSLQ